MSKQGHKFLSTGNDRFDPKMFENELSRLLNKERGGHSRHCAYNQVMGDGKCVCKKSVQMSGIDLSKFDLDKKYKHERDLDKEVKKLFALFVPDLQVTRKEQGQYCVQTGVHDYLLCYKGLAGSVELKSETGKPTPKQLYWGREAGKAGRIIGYCWTLGEVLEVIKRLQEKFNRFFG